MSKEGVVWHWDCITGWKQGREMCPLRKAWKISAAAYTWPMDKIFAHPRIIIAFDSVRFNVKMMKP